VENTEPQELPGSGLAPALQPSTTRCLRSRKTRLASSTAILKAMRDDPTLSLDQANLREGFRVVREPLFD
jgi:hypothetical protein